MSVNDISTAVERIKKHHKWSTAEVAEALGVSPRTIEGWRQGRTISLPARKLIDSFLRGIK